MTTANFKDLYVLVTTNSTTSAQQVPFLTPQSSQMEVDADFYYDPSTQTLVVPNVEFVDLVLEGDILFTNDADHSISVEATTGATPGRDLTITAGGSANGNAGDLLLDAGNSSAATDGNVEIGTTNAEAVEIGRTGKIVLVNGLFNVTQLATFDDAKVNDDLEVDGDILADGTIIGDGATTTTGFTKTANVDSSLATVDLVKLGGFIYQFYEGGSVLTARTYIMFRALSTCEIVGVTLLSSGGVTGNVTVDIQTGTFAGFPTTASICGGTKPALAGTASYEDTTLTGWTKTITAGDIIMLEIEGTPATVTDVTISVQTRRL